ncbi:MAG: PDZ domain-containing protein [Bryobacterales bacterium]|nr:PDZ domain-containing protein [Bryobacterales bacterium]
MRHLRAAVLPACLAMLGIAGAQEIPFAAPQVRAIALNAGSYLGVGVADVTADRAQALKLKEERGVEITRVEDDSPAAKAGLKTGDVVLEYNGQRVEGTEQFVRMVRETPEGRQARLVVSRDGVTQTLTATIGARRLRGGIISPPFDTEGFRQEMEKLREQGRIMPDIPRPNLSWQSGVLGVEAEQLGSQLAEYFGVKEGVLVRSVNRDSAAEKAGIKAGDVILKVDEVKVVSPRDVTAAIRKLGPKTTFPVALVRNHKELSVSVTLPKIEGRPVPGRPAAPAAPAPPARPVRSGPML